MVQTASCGQSRLVIAGLLGRYFCARVSCGQTGFVKHSTQKQSLEKHVQFLYRPE
jgi:hypothetical protein